MSALYRTYRPQDFSEVVGQEHVVRTLRNAVEAGRVRHAYLFAGPRGTGKTSLAKILAKSLNCQASDGPTATPCRQCESCRSIHDATALDVIELDAASNRGIDDIREIRERVAVAPALGRRKVYILDEAHSLTTDASNALLKTLEEPPEHVVFVLCTTEPQRLLDTIKGRCQSFSFLRPTATELQTVLRRIAGAESIAADDDALAVIARAARGSFRDGVSQLDQLATACDGAIDGPAARALLGVTEDAVLVDIVDGIVGADAAGLLRRLDALVEHGQDLGQLIVDLLGHLRVLLLTRELGAPPESYASAPDVTARVEQQAAALHPRALTAFVDGLLAVQEELREGGDARLPLELLLVRLARPGSDRSIDAMLRRLDALEGAEGSPPRASVPAPVVAAPAPPPPAPARPPAPESPQPAPDAVASAPTAAPPTAPPIDPPSPPAPPHASSAPPTVAAEDLAELGRIWQQEVIPRVQEVKQSLAPALAPARPLALERDELRVGFPVSAAFQRTMAEKEAHRTIVAGVVSTVLGTRCRVLFETIEPAADEPVEAPTIDASVVTALDEADNTEEWLNLLRGEFDASEIEESG